MAVSRCYWFVAASFAIHTSGCTARTGLGAPPIVANAPPVDDSLTVVVVNEVVRGAREVGLIEKVSVAASGPPTAEQVVAIAIAARTDLRVMFDEARRRRDALGTWVGIGNFPGKAWAVRWRERCCGFRAECRQCGWV